MSRINSFFSTAEPSSRIAFQKQKPVEVAEQWTMDLIALCISQHLSWHNKNQTPVYMRC